MNADARLDYCIVLYCTIRQPCIICRRIILLYLHLHLWVFRKFLTYHHWQYKTWIAMSEMFGAVASGAGLLSLAVQLIESSQKLKKLYNASRDAPSAVADLCFELETMSLSLHQLESHRSKDVTGDELLGRCVATCTRMVTKIQQAVSKIESLLQKSRMVGRLYMAFKEPEMNKLLGEMEQAKSSMSFAYMSYCQ